MFVTTVLLGFGKSLFRMSFIEILVFGFKFLTITTLLLLAVTTSSEFISLSGVADTFDSNSSNFCIGAFGALEGDCVDETSVAT